MIDVKESFMQGYWENEEIKELFYEVEEKKKKGDKIKEAFSKHAQKFARKENSVRNYYYFQLKNPQMLSSLGIDVKKHAKHPIEIFSKEEENQLICKLNQMTKEGMSVRKACLVLAEGDALKLLRYQNKYRNYLSKKQKQKVAENHNVITFKKPEGVLSDSEVQSLFMGLVRLVKRNAIIEGQERAKEKIESANARLKQLLLKLQVQSREIDKMKERYEKLKEENNALALRLISSRCDKARVLREKFMQRRGEKTLEVEKFSKRD